MIFQNLIKLLQFLLFVALISIWTTDSFGGGFQGGSNGTLPSGKHLNQNRFIHHGDWYEWRNYSVVFNKIPMQDKDQAVKAAVATMNDLTTGNASEDFVKKLYKSDKKNMRNTEKEREKCANHFSRRRVDELVKNGYIKPKGFDISEPVYKEDDKGKYKEYYSYSFRVEFPCRLKRDDD